MALIVMACLARKRLLQKPFPAGMVGRRVSLALEEEDTAVEIPLELLSSLDSASDCEDSVQLHLAGQGTKLPGGLDHEGFSWRACKLRPGVGGVAVRSHVALPGAQVRAAVVGGRCNSASDTMSPATCECATGAAPWGDRWCVREASWIDAPPAHPGARAALLAAGLTEAGLERHRITGGPQGSSSLALIPAEITAKSSSGEGEAYLLLGVSKRVPPPVPFGADPPSVARPGAGFPAAGSEERTRDPGAAPTVAVVSLSATTWSWLARDSRTWRETQGRSPASPPGWPAGRAQTWQPAFECGPWPVGCRLASAPGSGMWPDLLPARFVVRCYERPEIASVRACFMKMSPATPLGALAAPLCPLRALLDVCDDAV